MSINQQLPDYTNSEGEVFSLRLVNAPPTKGHDDRWEYLVVAKNKSWGREEFRVLLKKTAFASEEEAQEFILGEPLEDVKKRLDTLDEDPIDLFELDMSKGWAVV
ncbi:MAG: hypothetical protein GWP14_04795 [Actinobacteria bacterium]|nr:hypothetical protein [Actinomycetota bacterium]